MIDYKSLLDNLDKRNLAESLDKPIRDKIARQVIDGFKIDQESMSAWLDLNLRAMDLIHHQGDVAKVKNKPFNKASRVFYPLLAPAVIQSTARIVPHFKRNDHAIEVGINGKDETGEITQRADRVNKYTNYKLLKDSDWMLHNYKLASILTSWGHCFRKLHYNELKDRVEEEIIHPKDVIINNATQSLQDAPRVTIFNYLNKSDIYTQIALGYFNSDLDLKELNTNNYENIENDSKDEQPIYEILEQHFQYDLDDDGYDEPYCAWVHAPSNTLLGLYPAYDQKSILVSPKTGKVAAIERKLNLVDYSYLEDPDGGYYGMGLNALLVDQNLSIIAILRNLIDSGTIANYQGGFCTKAIKTKQQDIQFDELGQFKRLETSFDTDLAKAFLLLPTKEPSDVLFKLLGFLVESGKEVGFITDILTGDTPAQNVPATTILALIEQGTRAFKPIIQKLYFSLRKEMVIRFDLMLNVSDDEYQKFHNDPNVYVTRDFELDSLDICPVADPTLASEAHKYAQVQAIKELLPILPNGMAALAHVLQTLEINPQLIQAFMTPPQGGQAPDPKLVKVQTDYQAKMAKIQSDTQLKLEQLRADQEQQQADNALKAQGLQVDAMNSMVKARETAQKIQNLKAEQKQAHLEPLIQMQQLVQTDRKHDLEEKRLRILAQKSGNSSSS